MPSQSMFFSLTIYFELTHSSSLTIGITLSTKVIVSFIRIGLYSLALILILEIILSHCFCFKSLTSLISLLFNSINIIASTFLL